MDPFAGVRVSDLVTFLTVQRTRSVSSAARELKVTASQVSKAIGRLEARLGKSLLTRGSRGVALSAAGIDILPSVATVIEAMRKLQDPSLRATVSVERTIAGPSYLVARLVPAIAVAHPRLHLQGLELNPGVLRAALSENSFDIALIAGEVPAAAGWTVDRIGNVRASLFASPSVAEHLGTKPVSPARVRTIPFVVPLVSPKHFSVADDGCPLPARERRAEHHMQTVGSALELAAITRRHAVFAPELAARPYLRARTLVEIPVAGWNVVEPLLLLCSIDRVLDRERKAIRKTIADVVERGMARG